MQNINSREKVSRSEICSCVEKIADFSETKRRSCLGLCIFEKQNVYMAKPLFLRICKVFLWILCYNSIGGKEYAKNFNCRR